MCGQAAFILSSRACPTKIKYVSIYQDVNGGDGAGWAQIFKDTSHVKHVRTCPIPDDTVFKEAYQKVHYRGEDYTSSLQEALLTEHNIFSFETGSILLTHARKTTVGDTEIALTQPFKLASGENAFVVAQHNGTIHNYKALCQKYQLGEPKNDSHAFALAVKANKEQEFLADVEGLAACIWAYSDQPSTLYACSLSYVVKGQRTTSRPLHYVIIEGTLYMARSATPLFMIAALYTDPGVDRPTVYKLSDDIVYKFKQTKDEIIFECFPKLQRPEPKPLVYTKTNNKVATTKSSSVEEKGYAIIFNDTLPKDSEKSMRLDICRGLYYLTGELLTTPFTMQKGEVTIREQTLVSLRGSVYFKNATTGQITNAHGENVDESKLHLFEAFFLNGILCRSKESFKDFVLFFETITEKEYLKYAGTPIWKNALAYNKYVTKKNCSFNAPSFIEGYMLNQHFYYPFTNKCYSFVNSYVSSIWNLRRDTAARQTAIWVLSMSLISAGLELPHKGSNTTKAQLISQMAQKTCPDIWDKVSYLFND